MAKVIQREYIENAIMEITEVANHSNDLYDIYKTIKVKIYTPRLPEPPELVKKRINEFEGKLVNIDHYDWSGDSIVGKFLKAWWDEKTNEGFAEIGIFNKAKAVLDLIKEGKIKYFSPSFWVSWLGENIVDVLPNGGALCQYTIPDDLNCEVVDHSGGHILYPNIHKIKAEHSKALKEAEERGFKKAKTILELHSKYEINEEVEKKIIEAIDNGDALNIVEIINTLKPKDKNDATAIAEHSKKQGDISPKEYVRLLRECRVR